jgi:hypothetical protein
MKTTLSLPRLGRITFRITRRRAERGNLNAQRSDGRRECDCYGLMGFHKPTILPSISFNQAKCP